MNIQSLSITVPTNGCVNRCKYCVSRTHFDSWICNRFKDNDGSDNLLFSDYKKRLRFARDNNTNTVILTGTGEPLQNPNFLIKFFNMNKELPSPFEWIEIQTSGVMLEKASGFRPELLETLTESGFRGEKTNLEWLREMGVTTISLSLSNIFDSERNAEITGMSPKLKIDIDTLCKKIKDMGFNLRLSLNMTSDYDNVTPEEIFNRANELGADQITFRVLYHSENNTTEDQWIINNSCNSHKMKEINDYIKTNGTELDLLPFGAMRYDVDGISAVVDDDCMNMSAKKEMKYLILREDARLYSRWNFRGSLIF